MTRNPDIQAITVRLPRNLIEALDVMAKASRLSRNDLLVKMIEHGIDREVESRQAFNDRLDWIVEQDRETLDLLSR